MKKAKSSFFRMQIGSASACIEKWLLTTFIFSLFFAFLTPNLLAQSATIRGEITDAQTGEALIGANVVIAGTDKGTATDIDGRYVLRRVDEGEVTLIFRYIGYESREVIVEVSEGETLTQNMQLSATTLEGEEIQVTARQRGQSRALSEQRESANIKAVISAEQIEAFADNTVTGALSRIAGMGHGGTNIRGVGAGASNVTMDGQRMGSTGGDRSVDLSTISADMVQDLEVIKVITPDMDADALSGVINVNTRRPVGGERDMNIRIGGGIQDRYFRHSGGNQRVSFSYGDSPDETYSYGINLSYQRDPNARETFRTDWENGNFGQGPVDILSDIGTDLNIDVPQRIGTGLQFTFQPNDRTTYHIQGMFNFQDRVRRQYAVSYNPRRENYTGQTQTGYPDGSGGPDAANQSTIGYNPRLDEATTQQYTVQAGARHRLNNFDMEYSLGWGHGRFSDDQYRMEFETFSRHEFVFNLDDRWNPTVEVAPWSEIPQYPEPNQMIFQSMDHRINSNVDNDLKATIDFEIPYALGELKVGSSASLTFKHGVGERLNREYSSRLDVSAFQLIENGSWQIFDRPHSTYRIPWLVELEKARDFYVAQTPRFQTDLEEWALSTETSRYAADEHTFATYAMGEVEWAWLKLLGGLRVEHTLNKYEGREGEISDSGIFRGAKDISGSSDYTNLFPNLQFVFSLGRMTNIRLAYSRSIGRPSFNQLNPYIMRNYNNQTIQQGNPNLDPMLSNNYDVLFEHYFMNVGQLTFGLFYKDMKDFVFAYTERIQGNENEEDAEFVGWRRSGYRNGEQATVYGAEFTWQQNLDFLPGFLSNLGTYFNYSYAQSIADLGRTEENTIHGLARLFETLGMEGVVDDFQDYKYVTPLSGQRPHVINAGLDYRQNNFDAQISLQWAAPSISSYGSNDRQWIALTNQPEYFDEYNDAARDVSFTLRYWLSSNFQVWFDASNILNYKEVNYYFDREYYPSTTELRGREFTFGLRYRL